MISKEEFEKLINNLRGKLDETTVALVSEEILATISAYNNGFDEYEKSIEEVEKLKGEKEELLKVNGKLYQRGVDLIWLFQKVQKFLMLYVKIQVRCLWKHYHLQQKIIYNQ